MSICQMKLFRGKNKVMETKVNEWIRDFSKENPGCECKVRDITFTPNGTRDECDVMIVYDLIRSASKGE